MTGNLHFRDVCERLTLDFCPVSCRELLLNNNLLRVLPYELGRLFQLQTLGLKGERSLSLLLIWSKSSMLYFKLTSTYGCSPHTSKFCLQIVIKCNCSLKQHRLYRLVVTPCRKPSVPRHPQSVPGAGWNQKAFELHARQSSR